MENLGVQDYSLLVGIHPLNPEDKKQDLGDLVTRVQKLVFYDLYHAASGSPDVGLMLVHRLRRCPTLNQHRITLGH